MADPKDDGDNLLKQSPRPSSGLWWIKTPKDQKSESPRIDLTSSPFDISSSMAEFLEKEQLCEITAGGDASDADIASIIEEINRLAAESPGLKSIDHRELVDNGDRSVEDILKEAEKLVEESSVKFEQLSSRSSISSRSRSMSLTTPKSTKSTPRSPRYLNEGRSRSKTNEFEILTAINSKDNSQKSSKHIESLTSDSSKTDKSKKTIENSKSSVGTSSRTGKSISSDILGHRENAKDSVKVNSDNDTKDVQRTLDIVNEVLSPKEVEVYKKDNERLRQKSKEIELEKEKLQNLHKEMKQKDMLLKEYEKDNQRLQAEIKSAKNELEMTKNKLKVETPVINSPKKEQSLQIELDNALENLKDLKEHNTVLQVQLDTLNNSHQLLKTLHDEVMQTNKTLERKVVESDNLITKLRNELKVLQEKYDTLLESESFFKKATEAEKLHNKSLKLQTEKDAKCIQDLTRQVKEMDRIMVRKHPDSVSALIVTANNNTDQNWSARRILEERIKHLESEARNRETHSSKIFADVQEKFNEMKLKYESHIEDLEHHVADLKSQLNRKVSQVDVNTQTVDQNKNVEFIETGVQTFVQRPQRLIQQPKKIEKKEDAHLLATIRGLNMEISTKDKLMIKLQKEMDELKRTNKKLQKEREVTLKANMIERVRLEKCYNPNEYKVTYERDADIDNMNLEMDSMKDERDKLRNELCRLEDDYHMLKLKRLQDLNTLQEAHEQELTNYMAKMSPLREQLEVQQVTINKLQSQLSAAKEQVAILTVERDHLDSRLKMLRHLEETTDECGNNEYSILKKKITQLERRYEDRELRLRAIVHGLAQKQVNSNRNCEQCMLRQQQLCGYKAELDQVLLTLRNHTNL